MAFSMISQDKLNILWTKQTLIDFSIQTPQPYITNILNLWDQEFTDINMFSTATMT